MSLVRAQLVTGFGLVLLAAVTGAACGGAPASEVAQKAAPSASAAAPPRALTPAEIAKRVTPSVVAIRGARSLGSGFIVHKDGWVATNLHVLIGARELKVVLKDSSEHAVAEVLAVDSEHDLALLRIDKAGLPVLTVGDSSAVRPGDAVVAIGHPLGLEDTVSDGLVSAVREVNPTLTLLQISAPIAPGSSGGPLIDSFGHVIGIATMVSREGQNLAFGVPSSYLKTLMANTSPVPWRDFIAAREGAGPGLPAPKRNIPTHALSFVAGCGEGDLRLLGSMIGKAIDVGAPLYNSGNFEACYHVYEGASLDAERKLGAGCPGPKKALADGRRRAAALTDPSAQAWAMRDAFDGLIDVIVRRLGDD